MNEFLKDCEICNDEKAVFLKHTYSLRQFRWFCEKCSLEEKANSKYHCSTDCWEKLDLPAEAAKCARNIIKEINGRRHDLLDAELKRDLAVYEMEELLDLQKRYERAVSVAHPVDATVVKRLVHKLNKIQGRLTP